MIRTTPLTAAFVVLLLTGLASAERLVCRYDIAADGSVSRSTEHVVSGKGVAQVRHEPASGTDPATVQAIDLATGRALKTRTDRGAVVAILEAPLAERAERRVTFVERWPAGRQATLAGSALTFEAELLPGRHTVILPAGFILGAASSPVQVLVRESRVHAGTIVPDGHPLRLRLEATATNLPVSGAAPAGAFRAEDARSIVYWLEDPEAHRLTLALELFLDRQGQKHAYSQLRVEDNITNPSTLDVDRGVELPTRIVTGAAANALGDAPAPFAADASVLVADLVEPVPAGGNVRVRLYQTATDPKEYGLQPGGELRYDRFLARLATRIVLPEGWDLTSTDQPATVSRDARGRVVLDFTKDGGDTAPLLITARRRSPSR